MGDILLTTPLLRALRTRHPDAELVMLTRGRYTPLLRHNPRLNEVISLDGSLAAVAGEVRRRGFTHRLDLQGNARSLMLRLLAPGPWNGYDKRRAERRRLIRRHLRTLPDVPPVAERYFESARDLDVRPDGKPAEFFLGPSAAAEAGAWLAGHRVHDEDRLIALAPGAAHATKRWPVQHWQTLARQLVAMNFRLIILGGPGEESVGHQVAEAAPGHAVNAAGATGLELTGALVQRSDALVVGDTGLMHMATALGRPVVALFGPTVEGFGFFPYRASSRVLERDLPCRPCTLHGGARCPLGHHRCLADITPGEVSQALEPLLA